MTLASVREIITVKLQVGINACYKFKTFFFQNVTVQKRDVLELATLPELYQFSHEKHNILELNVP